jgi:hypothetical protein
MLIIFYITLFLFSFLFNQLPLHLNFVALGYRLVCLMVKPAVPKVTLYRTWKISYVELNTVKSLNVVWSEKATNF